PTVMISVAQASAPSRPVASPAALAPLIQSAAMTSTLTSNERAQVLATDIRNPLTSAGLPLALQQHCFSSVDRTTLNNPKPCIFGNPRSTTTVVLFGSSAVDNWTPALQIAATQLGIRVATFQFEGCFTPFVTGLGPNCTTFHNNLPRAISALHPTVIMAVASADSAGVIGDARYVQGMQRAFEAVGQLSPSARRVVWGTTPRMNAPVPSCLIMRPRTINSCGLTYSASSTAPHSYGQILRRDVLTAQQANATLVPVSSWFCSATFCPAVIAGKVVFVDHLHVTATYSRYLATLVTAQLQRVLTPDLLTVTTVPTVS
ncbi:MAG: SGNH hydrolase domain-containing protein, partial [Actinomycetes bacterium]